jgi:hypothetical protein
MNMIHPSIQINVVTAAPTISAVELPTFAFDRIRRSFFLFPAHGHGAAELASSYIYSAHGMDPPPPPSSITSHRTGRRSIGRHQPPITRGAATTGTIHASLDACAATTSPAPAAPRCARSSTAPSTARASACPATSACTPPRGATSAPRSATAATPRPPPRDATTTRPCSARRARAAPGATPSATPGAPRAPTPGSRTPRSSRASCTVTPPRRRRLCRRRRRLSRSGSPT